MLCSDSISSGTPRDAPAAPGGDGCPPRRRRGFFVQPRGPILRRFAMKRDVGRRRLLPLTAAERTTHVERALDLFNAGAFWAAHEALEAVWRSAENEEEALVFQGLIQAAAALLHRDRGNRHGVEAVGTAALGKLAGPQRADVEFETVMFRDELRKALFEGGPAPVLTLRSV